jgi:Lar family restriction alleviation protein
MNRSAFSQTKKTAGAVDEPKALKPCPFCGGDRITVWSIRDGQQAVCKDCKSTGAPTYHGPEGFEATEGKARAAWNRRASDSAHEGLVAALKMLVGAVDRTGGNILPDGPSMECARAALGAATPTE